MQSGRLALFAPLRVAVLLIGRLDFLHGSCLFLLRGGCLIAALLFFARKVACLGEMRAFGFLTVLLKRCKKLRVHFCMRYIVFFDMGLAGGDCVGEHMRINRSHIVWRKACVKRVVRSSLPIVLNKSA